MNIKLLIAIQILTFVAHGFFDIEAPDVFDMTTSEGIYNATTDGFDLSEPPYRIFFKVGNSLNDTDQGYAWVSDGARCAGFLQTIVLDPEFNPDGTGEQTIRLDAYGFGNCTYRLAYVNTNNFTSFDNATDAVQIIEIPISIR